MFTKRIIPCLDVKNGRVVKGVNFVNLQDAGDPVEIAAAYDAAGADELVFLDITASSDAREYGRRYGTPRCRDGFYPFNGRRRYPHRRGLPYTPARGRDKISINSAAIQNPSLIHDAAEKFGRQCVVVAIDARRRADGSAGISTATAVGLTPALMLSNGPNAAMHSGAGEILLTSMDCDGTKSGYDLELTRTIAGHVSVPVIASGGARHKGTTFTKH